MPLKLLHLHLHRSLSPTAKPLTPSYHLPSNLFTAPAALNLKKSGATRLRSQRQRSSKAAISASLGPLDLTEDNIKQVLDDARVELAQLFDSSVNITGG
ncbi:UNVERIFIED_CONTAM: hypothetical protein Sradi_5311800 [Sesamum radiatum]|uniref:Uncharacterized protein n=1 Tax=Sesamum radiatum TaxID=300843 RepID=A0AAW2LP70_SESRA